MHNDPDYRSHFESLIDELHDLGFKITSDEFKEGIRTIILKKYQIIITSSLNNNLIEFDIYADLKAGIYEIGDLHLMTRKMLQAKKVFLSYDAKEINTTERLYPSNRQGKQTQTSGL